MLGQGLEKEINSESSRGMTSSINCGHREETFGKPLMENGDCSFLARPMYKQRKVSVIRDLPEGCGLFASRMDPDFRVDISDSNISVAGPGGCIGEARSRRYLTLKKVSAVREFPPLCGSRVPCLSKDDCQKGISSLNNNKAGQQVLAVDNSLLEKAAATDEYRKRKLPDIVNSEGNAKFPSENKRGKYIALPEKSNHPQVSIKTKAVVTEESRNAVKVEGTSGLAHPKVQSLWTKPLDMSTKQHKLKGGYNECSSKSNLSGGPNESKGRKSDIFARKDRSETVVRACKSLNHSLQTPLKKKMVSAPSDDRGQLVMREKKDSLHPNKNDKNIQIVPKSHSSNVNVFPSGHNNSGGHENSSNLSRSKVMETLRFFHDVYRKLLHEATAKSNDRASTSKRVDLQAAKILKEKGKYINTGKQILGSVPGVEVGDKFQYRVELNIVGLHRQLQGGIDCVKHYGKVLATAIVASGGYADNQVNSDVLIYTGQGGNVMSADKLPEDQKLERGNLALKNSIEEKNAVRVIRGSDSLDKKYKTYVYDGLYQVESYWQDMGPHGKLVYKFRLERIRGQPKLSLKRSWLT